MVFKLLVLTTVVAALVLPGCDSGPSKSVGLTSDNFAERVLKSNKLVLVDFWAEWCGPCRTMDPVIKSLAAEFDGKVVFGKLNVDDYPDIAQTYGINGIPAFLVFKGGVLKHRVMGVVPRQSLSDVLMALQ